MQTMKAAQEAGEMLTRLVPDIKKTAQLVAEISAASREQDAGAEQINKAIQQLDKVTQQNAAGSEQMSGTSEELAAQAELLQAAISFFRIDAADSAPAKQQPAHHVAPAAPPQHGRSAGTAQPQAAAKAPPIRRSGSQPVRKLAAAHGNGMERAGHNGVALDVVSRVRDADDAEFEQY
jgi:methyl-accepting chemotaxis protein